MVCRPLLRMSGLSNGRSMMGAEYPPGTAGRQGLAWFLKTPPDRVEGRSGELSRGRGVLRVTASAPRTIARAVRRAVQPRGHSGPGSTRADEGKCLSD